MKTIDKTKINSILLLMLGGIGDILVSTPTISRLKKEFPQARISVIMRDNFKDLLAGNPQIDEIISYRKNALLLRKLLMNRYDVFIDLHTPTYNTFCSNRRIFLRNGIIAALAHAGDKIGFKGFKINLFFTHPLLAKDIKYANLVDLTAEVLGPLGVSDLDERRKVLVISKKDKDSVSGKLSQAGVSQKNFIALHPFSKQSAKNWPLENYVRLIEQIKQYFNMDVVLLGDKEDVDSCGLICARVPCSDLSGGLTLGETAAVINDARLLVCIDSGLMHIGDALEKDAVVLFSAHNAPGIWGPVSEKMSVLRKNVPCSPCFKKECPDNRCMSAITIDEVMDKIKERLACR